LAIDAIATDATAAAISTDFSALAEEKGANVLLVMFSKKKVAPFQLGSFSFFLTYMLG
jgi:predicted TIM-barrel enzyme